MRHSRCTSPKLCVAVNVTYVRSSKYLSLRTKLWARRQSLFSVASPLGSGTSLRVLSESGRVFRP